MTLQEEVEGGSASPHSHYSNWLGSPNSHSNEDFEAWNSFRTRTSSNASTVSGHHSPFASEQDDLGETDVHVMYPGVSGAKLTPTLPRLSKVAGSMGQHGSENVMESLLDNLNLLSPKNPHLGSDSQHSTNSAMLPNSPYCSSGLPSHPQQNYHKCVYGQVRINSPSPVLMQTVPETKQSFGAYENPYICAAGLLKELLTSDADANRDMMPSGDTQMSQVERGGSLMATYSSSMVGHNGVAQMKSPQSHTVRHVNPQTICGQASSTSQDLNSCNMIPLTSMNSLSGASPQMSSLRTCMQLPQGLTQMKSVSANYSNKGYRELNSAHQHGHHQERLPSDLDNMSIERFECDMESVIHDMLMEWGGPGL